jgi:hypothetical protein
MTSDWPLLKLSAPQLMTELSHHDKSLLSIALQGALVSGSVDRSSRCRWLGAFHPFIRLYHFSITLRDRDLGLALLLYLGLFNL